VHRPHLAIRDLVDGGPHFFVIDTLQPIRPQVAVKQHAHPACQPASGMDAVGDVRDRHFLIAQIGPQEAPHAARNLAVQFRYGVALLGEFERQHWHTEHIAPVLILSREIDKLLAVQAKLGPDIREVLVNQPQRELVVAGRYRSVGGENIRLAHALLGGIQVHAGGHVFAQALDYQESRVALVHVPNNRLEAQQPQRAHPANSQQNFLRNTRIGITAVQARGELAVVGHIALHVSVHQDQRHAPNLYFPQTGQHRPPGKLHFDGQRFAVFLHQRDDRHVIQIEFLIADLLPAVFGDEL